MIVYKSTRSTTIACLRRRVCEWALFPGPRDWVLPNLSDHDLNFLKGSSSTLFARCRQFYRLESIDDSTLISMGLVVEVQMCLNKATFLS